MAKERAKSRSLDPVQFGAESTDGYRGGLAFALREGGTTPQMLTQFYPESNHAFGVICGMLAKIEAVKGKSYLASFCRQGVATGVLPNLLRKMDRIDAIVGGMTDGQITIDGGENLATNCADLAVYCIKLITVIAQTNPDDVLKWLETDVRATK